MTFDDNITPVQQLRIRKQISRAYLPAGQCEAHLSGVCCTKSKGHKGPHRQGWKNKGWRNSKGHIQYYNSIAWYGKHKRLKLYRDAYPKFASDFYWEDGWTRRTS